MFKESKRHSGTDTLIGHGTQAEGKLICGANLRIEGEYRGDIECTGSVIVGESGIARSNLAAKDVIIAGKVFGDVTARGRLTITANGHLYGNVTAGSFILQDGGILNGNCRMERQEEGQIMPLSETGLPEAPGSQFKEAAGVTPSIPSPKDNAREKARQAG